MKRCSYRWEQCNEEVQCPEEIWSGSEEYCIFHDSSPDKDVKLFEEKLKEKLGRKDYSFVGYFFPEKVDLTERRFEENADFTGAVFRKDADFRRTTFRKTHFIAASFQKDASFTGATFHKDVYFSGAAFQYAYFIEASFKKEADFKGATFQKADFSGVNFQKANFLQSTFRYVSFLGANIERNLEFTPKKVKRLDLQYAQFLFKGHITVDLSRTRFYRAGLENVAFVDCRWPERIYEETHSEKMGLSFAELETIYRDLKQNMQRHGDYSRAGEFYYREMEMRRKGTKAKKRRLWLELYRLLAGYGEKPQLIVRNSFLVILLGAILFFFCGVARVGAEIPPEENPYIIDYSLDSLSLSITTFKDFYYCFYYSVVTFTTLGYGDIHPLGHSHTFAFLEALTGAFFMALFVVVFARKMMR